MRAFTGTSLVSVVGWPGCIRTGARARINRRASSRVIGDAARGAYSDVMGTPTRSCDHPRVPDERDDAELVRRIGEGETDALEVLYARYGSILFGMAFRCARRSPGRRGVHAGRLRVRLATRAGLRLRAWVGQLLDDRRSRRNRAVDSPSPSAPPARPTLTRRSGRATNRPTRPTRVAAVDSSSRVAAALAELPAPQREALLLAYFQGLSHNEIAERLGLPLGTVKGRVRLALDRLRVLAPKYALDAERRA